ncbi:MAG: sigma-54 dependent transcriptional regulator [candidate division KSB1 bacterium]|nr:sigma-54 dependent transcriptional regulator [candidate division KSB1 bacterium]
MTEALTAREKKTILVVDDERDLLLSLQKALSKEGYRVLIADRARQALEILQREAVDVVLSDLRMPEMGGTELLRECKRINPEVEVIMLTAYGTVESAVEAMKEGAYDFITKPFKRVTVVKAIQKALEKQALSRENLLLRRQLETTRAKEQMIGASPAIQRVLELVQRVAPTNTTVLITGESGTGKELVARLIHQFSPRRNAPFIAINCGAIPENLIESELFGHVRGAFTGATRDKDGLFKVASGGTLFLDEVCAIPLNLQVRLLRAIEEKEFLPVGGTRPVRVDVRILAASNRNLAKEVEEGRFREDLYYRLNVVNIDLPPLRERKEDIPLLVQYFIDRHNRALGKRVRGVDEETMGVLVNYEWKGNVRELENVIERAMILCDDELIRVYHLPPNLAQFSFEAARSDRLREAVREFERQHIYRILERVAFDKLAAARILGVSQSSLYRKLAELDIRVPKKLSASKEA